MYHDAEAHGAFLDEGVRHLRPILFEDHPGPGFVYFAMADEGLIKIGYTRNLRQRLRGLRTTTKTKIEMVAHRHGSRDTESVYHFVFWRQRIEGEWFERHPDILAEIERLNA